MSPDAPRFYGVYRGVVVDADDPEQRGRIKVRVPAVTGVAVTGWAWPCFPPLASPQTMVLELPADPVYANYTPVWTATGDDPVVGSSTYQGRYVRIENLVWFSIRIEIASNFQSGTGLFYSFGLPPGLTAGYHRQGVATLRDWSAERNYVFAADIGPDFVQLLRGEAATGNAAVVGPTNPVVLSQIDSLYITGLYETTAPALPRRSVTVDVPPPDWSPPAAGRGVWVMYEGGDPDYPVWTGMFESRAMTEVLGVT